jgi:hypothetical protein
MISEVISGGLSQTTYKIHYKAGGCMLAGPVDPFHHEGSGFLPEEKSGYQKYIGIPGKTNVRDKP